MTTASAPTSSLSPGSPSPGCAVLAVGARRLTELAEQVRQLAAGLTLAAADTGWRSTAATACRDRLGDLARDLLGAAALLDHAAAVVEDHSRTAAHRAAVLEHAALKAARAGLLGVLVGAAS